MSVSLSNLLGQGPAVRAYLSANQTFTSGVATILQVNTVDFDTNSNYNTSTYRFQPTVAGYYSATGSIILTYVGGNGPITAAVLNLRKNGNVIEYSEVSATNGLGATALTVSTLINMNGTSDYFDLQVLCTVTTGTSYSPAGESSNFTAFLARLP
jgi:hypothetical protein